MNPVTVTPAYTKLLARIPPKVIRTEAENEHYINALYALEQKRSLKREEKELADLLTLLIEDFEAKRYQLPRATPRQALSFLMGSTVSNRKTCWTSSEHAASFPK